MGKPVPNVPRRCRKVYDELWRRSLFPAHHPKAWMREIDLINATGQSCAGVKLRQLRGQPENLRLWEYRFCERSGEWHRYVTRSPLVITKIRRSADGKRTWAEHRLSRSWKAV